MSALTVPTFAEPDTTRAIQLKKIGPKHHEVASLLAQGVGRQQIAEVTGFTPEYITWLLRDPLFREHMRQKSEFVDALVDAQYERVADAIVDGLTNGAPEDRLKAARLQLELTGRIGKGERPNAALESSVERLSTLAERLLALQSNVRKGVTYNGEVEIGPVQSAQQG